MNSGKERFQIDEIKQTDMVNYLSKLGYEPGKIRNADYWYLSPLRNEKTPSFKVNRKINRWFDHGLGKGGNLIDFGILYHNCSVGEFLQKISSGFSLHQPHVSQSNYKEDGHKITILQDFAISSFALIKFLEHRKISIDIAGQFCRQVRYQLNDKTYYGIGFKNDSGGYEIRNPYFKASSSPKDVTTHYNSGKDVLVFEGFIDFLSFMVIDQEAPKTDTDFLILNSVSFFEKARSFMEQHESIGLYLDSDATGQNCTQYALSLSKKYRDESKLYKNHKDLNECLMNAGNKQKKQLKQELR